MSDNKISSIKLPDNTTYDIYGKNMQKITWADYEQLPDTDKQSDTAYFITNVPTDVSENSAYGSASGSIATFTDGADDKPVKNLVIDIESQQDLHGYDYPWVGGTGKNKCPDKAVSSSNTTIYIGQDDLDAFPFTLTGGTTYTLSFVTSKNVSAVYLREENETSGTLIGSSSPVTFTATATGNYKIAIVASESITPNDFTNIQLELGSSATAFAPYSNICPISGFTGVNVAVTGVNIWDEQWEEGSYNASGVKANSSGYIRSKNFVPVLPNTTYYFNASDDAPSNRICFYDKDKNFLSRTNSAAGNKVFTTPDKCYFLTCYFELTTYNNDISINYPSTDTSYHAYNGSITSISLNSTRYGGTLDAVSGSYLDCDSTIQLNSVDSFSSDELNANGYIRYNCVVSDKARNYNIMCDKIKVINTTVREDASSEMISGSASNNKLYFTIDSTRLTGDLSTAAGRRQALKTLLQTDDIQVVYELATPQTYQLTPTEVKSLLGQNNFFADCGDVKEVVYVRCNTNQIRLHDEVVAGGATATYALDAKTLNGRDIVELTQAEYDALSYDEKHNGNVYCLPDVEQPEKKIYGFHINGNESNPSSMVTYLADAVGMTPAYMDYANNKFEYGSWQDAFFMPRPCILGQDGTVLKYLNPNDYTKDINGNTVTIDSGLTNANVMIEFPKIWYKVVADANDNYSGSVYISNVKADADYKDYTYIDYQGVHKDHFYMPAYNGSLVDSTLRSISGAQVMKSKTAAEEITYATANGNGWYTEDFGEIQLINFLLILMGKSTDTQTVFGQGIHTSGNETFNDGFRTGVHNTKGLFYGTNSGSASYSNTVKVFGIENWWGFQWRRYAGHILDNGVQKVKLCYGQEDGSTVNGYNTDGTGYVVKGDTPSGTSGGYIKKMTYGNGVMLPSTTGATSTTYYGDGLWYTNTSTRYAYRGGASDAGSRVGAFYVALSAVAAHAWWDIGAAVSYK